MKARAYPPTRAGLKRARLDSNRRVADVEVDENVMTGLVQILVIWDPEVTVWDRLELTRAVYETRPVYVVCALDERRLPRRAQRRRFPEPLRALHCSVPAFGPSSFSTSTNSR